MLSKFDLMRIWSVSMLVAIAFSSLRWTPFPFRSAHKRSNLYTKFTGVQSSRWGEWCGSFRWIDRGKLATKMSFWRLYGGNDEKNITAMVLPPYSPKKYCFNKIWVKHWKHKLWITFKLLSFKIQKSYE